MSNSTTASVGLQHQPTRCWVGCVLVASVLVGCDNKAASNVVDPEPRPPVESAASDVGQGSSSSADLLRQPEASAGPRHNLLLVSLDTTRTDYLGCYGAEEAETPNLDGLAQRGVLFEEAYTPAPMTLPAHATLLTGLLPPEHGGRVNGEHRVADDVPMLSEELQAAGYRTGAFIAAFVLNHRFGLARGFDHYDDDLTGAYEQEVPSGLARYRPGEVVVNSALEWLEEGETSQPFFAWVHLYDAHYPWFSHEESDAPPVPGSGTYEGELTYMDQQVGRLLAFLEERGLTEKTVVVAVADHGEGLGDHGEIEHAYLLNEEVLHVPWVMAGPGVKAAHRVPALVSLEDFRPTVNELLGLPVPTDVHGRSLVAALRGNELESSVSYAETDLPWTAYRWSPQRSLTTERWKYIRTPMAELYDRAKDREELVNLIEVKPAVYAEMEAQLADLEANLEARESSAASLSSEEIEQLAALGYTVGGGGEGVEAAGELADVKARLTAKSLAARLREGIAKGTLDPQTQLGMAQELVQLSPETPSFHEHFGTALLNVGQVEAGLTELQLVVGLDPDNAGAHYTLGDALQQHGNNAKAREHLEKALELEPKMASAHVGMGNVLRAEGRQDLAAGRYTQALDLRGGVYPEAHFNLALTYLDRGNPEKAAQHFQLAAEQRPGWAQAHASLANLYANWGKGVEAIAQYRIALELLPQDVGLRIELGLVFRAVNRGDEAGEEFLEAARIAPRFFKPQVELGNLAFESGAEDEALQYYEKALSLDPGHAEPTTKLARFLATCPEDKHRDGPRAVALAERAADLTGGQNPRILDTLAAACATAGDFARAVSVAHRAQRVALDQGNADLARTIEERLALYALEKPYFAPRPDLAEPNPGGAR